MKKYQKSPSYSVKLHMVSWNKRKTIWLIGIGPYRQKYLVISSTSRDKNCEKSENGQTDSTETRLLDVTRACAEFQALCGLIERI